MNEYGKLNGAPIDPGEEWEIVPLYSAVQKGTQKTFDGINWFPLDAGFGLFPAIWVDTGTSILAFRRPIAKPVAVANEVLGKLKAFKPHWESPLGENHGLNSCPGDRWIAKPTESFADVEALIASLRTLTAAQAVALEKVGEKLKILACRCDCGRESGHAVICAVNIAKDALTLITAAKEVGK